MADVHVDQVNVVVADVKAATEFLKDLGVEVDEAGREWAGHHVAIATTSLGDQGFDVDLDSGEFARYWGGLPAGFTGVVLNLRVDQRADVDDLFARALRLGAKALHVPWDAFWGSRYAVVEAPGEAGMFVGLMSSSDPAYRASPPPPPT